MDILKTEMPYNCYCGTGEADKFASAFIFDGRRRADAASVKIAIVTDRIVSGYYYNSFEEQFLARGVKPVLVPVECDGAQKGLAEAASVYDFLVDFGFGHNDWIIALGGGGVLDVAGFCASIFDGGINFLAIPTTPDAMYEGAVAKKAYLNSKKLKNAISVPFTPDAVIIDPSYLKTVPDKIKHNGYADVIRLGILGNLNILIELVKGGNVREFLNHTYSLRHSIYETSPKLLDLGNELAAAIEGYFRFMNYSDGEALALSLMSCVEEKSRGPLARIYDMLGLPTKLEGVSTKSIMKVLKENLERNGNSSFEMVDMSDDEPRRWMVKKVTVEQACAILGKRLEVIKSDTEGLSA
jgi:3-dehydroquinate synthetase